MNFRIIFTYLSLFSLLALTSCDTKKDDRESSIKKKTADYISAFNKHDSKAIAALWAEDSDYTNPESGETIEGKKAIEEAFQSRFSENDDTQLDVKIGSIKFTSNDEAVENGTFIIKTPGEEPIKSRFKATFIKQNNDWLLSEIQEVGVAATPDQSQHLKELEWLIGEWVDHNDNINIETDYQWDKSKNFIVQKFSVSSEGDNEKELDGRQIIVWDPIKNKIRSWVFDSDGGFGEATWSKQGNDWVVETAQTLADGSRASSVNIFHPIDKDSYTWESTGREVGGIMLPNIDPIKVLRKKG